jgi:hypothetical protein
MVHPLSLTLGEAANPNFDQPSCIEALDLRDRFP